MRFSDNTISNLRIKLDKGEVSSLDLFNTASALAYKYQDDCNLFVSILDKKDEEKTG